MPVNYDTIAPDYDVFRRGGGPYLKQLVSLADKTPGRSFLEIGAGTGNNTRAMLEATTARITAVERSYGMIRQAAAKRVAAHWVQGDALALPVQSEIMDFLYSTYVLHHIKDLHEHFSECNRVLHVEGIAAFITVPQAFIHSHPMNQFFPSFAAIDSARFQPIPVVEAALRETGFRNVQSITTESPARPINQNYVDRIAQQFISTYALIPETEFREGLQRLQQEVSDKGQLDEPMVREATVVWGEK